MHEVFNIYRNNAWNIKYIEIESFLGKSSSYDTPESKTKERKVLT